EGLCSAPTINRSHEGLCRKNVPWLAYSRIDDNNFLLICILDAIVGSGCCSRSLMQAKGGPKKGKGRREAGPPFNRGRRVTPSSRRAAAVAPCLCPSGHSTPGHWQ